MQPAISGAANAIASSLGLGVLGSDWGSLDSRLIAKIAQCDREGNLIGAGNSVVAAPVKDGNIDLTFNWSSAFENSGIESSKPTLSAMLQSGELAQSVAAISQIVKAVPGAEKIGVDGKTVVGQIETLSNHARGRTGITKLNSTQIFTGHAPMKMSPVLYFRAVRNPASEVEMPLAQLMFFAHPAKLAHSYAEAFKEATNSKESWQENTMKTLFPSEAPKPIAFTYGGKTYAPMVIEGLSYSLVNNMSSQGMLECEVTLTLSGLASDDAVSLQDKIYPRYG